MDIIDLFTQPLSPIAWLALFINSFLSATILPLSSEVLYLTLLHIGNYPVWFLWLIATIGNSLGGITNLIIGRLFPEKITSQPKTKMLIIATKWIKCYGYYSLLLSWVPLIGDVLCIIAGWQRLNLKKCVFYLTLGKATRYLVLSLPFYF
ncbi:YqaA family protein [Thorsellia anophelis]|uniref:Membrane protein YqaA, SNARE-associated domain n=1 Tax=Thorsellia anophelis DSM 18579 TaxID=1123402 RepID=A0A1H9YPE8_9GAMM|nr:YqaA family protein [Thorsellia anophelis]SES70939.1 membrane protein YqaA, SNARE-associated domain [Thorsellia anophelis DSM 18579]